MQRIVAALIGLLTAVLIVVGVLVWTAHQSEQERLDELACIARAHATATISAMVPNVGDEGRVQTVSQLGELLESC